MRDPLRSLVYSMQGSRALVLFDLIATKDVPVHEDLLSVCTHMPVLAVHEICTNLEAVKILSNVKDREWKFDRILALEGAKVIASRILVESTTHRDTNDTPLSYACEICSRVSMLEDVYSSLVKGVSPTCCDRDMREHIVGETDASHADQIRQVLADIETSLITARRQSCPHGARD